jgi:DNA-binding MarR family transcriptional regulator
MSQSSEALHAALLIDRLDRLARFEAEASDLNPAQWEALRYFARANRFSRTPAALAAYLASTRGTISRTLASLEAKGYVQRSASTRDGRSVEFALTEKAETALAGDPLLALAAAMEAALGNATGALCEQLEAVLRAAIAGHAGRAFGACHACRHFRPDARPGASAPHLCALLDQPLADSESRLVCVEQEPVAA